VAGAATSAAPSTNAPTDPVRKVLVLGDSLMVDASPAITAMFEAAGAEVAMRASPGFGLTGLGISGADPHFRESWARLVEQEHPQLSVVMLGFWDQHFVEQHGVAGYTAVVEDAVDVLTRDGGRVLFLSVPPVDGEPPHPQDQAFAAAAAASGGRAAYADIAGSQEGPGGGYPVSFTAPDGTTVHLRKADGWHFCPDGAERVAQAVERAVVEEGLIGSGPVGWEQGPWREAGYYDECR
jgi:hypothetical protein